MEKPFVHLFEQNYRKYVYDVNTQVVLEVSEEVYEYLEDERKPLSAERESCIEQLKKEGFLSSNHIQKIEHPATKLLPYYIKNDMNYMILQITQNCNLKCDYCVYSGGYKTRKHNKKKMSFDMAKKGIDYLIEHSRNSSRLVLGFYGGEPLLEFPLIQKCVEYIEARVEDKEIWYAITTNATLLNERNIEFMSEHNFNVTLSIDGPKERHDENRKFVGSERGSYDTIVKNIKFLKERYNKFYKNNLRINTVLDTRRSFSEISDFFKETEVFKGINIRASVISDDFAECEREISEIYTIESRYEQFKMFLAAIGEINQKYVSPLLKDYIVELSDLHLGDRKVHRKSMGKRGHHAGPCIPGSDRIFMDVDGNFYPCEKVCEISELAKLGQVDTGIDLIQASNMLNIEEFTSDKCHKCWAYDFCTICVRLADDKKEDFAKNVYSRCTNVRNEAEENIKNYLFLKELGYNFDTMICEKRS